MTLLCATLIPTSSTAQPNQALDVFCKVAATTWANRRDAYVAKFQGEAPLHSVMESYWRHSFQGVSVPLPMTEDGWHLMLGDSKYVKNLAGLFHQELSLSYEFVPSSLPTAVDGVANLAAKLALPGSDLSPIELVRLAIAIDPEDVECDPNNLQDAVNDISAVFLKTQVLWFFDEAYLHQDGVLGHSISEARESWRYIFEGTTPGSLYEIGLRNENPGRYPYIGFELANDALPESMYSPSWMPLFFDAANEPTKEKLTELRDLASRYDFPDATFRNLDEKLALFE